MEDQEKIATPFDAPFKARPGDTFYILADIDNSGFVDLELEGKEALSLDGAMDAANEIVNDHGGEQFIVECRCFRKVTRGRIRVTDIKARPKAKARKPG